MYLSNWVSSNLDADQYGMDSIVSELEKQGWEVLECQIAKQKIQLMELLNEFGKQANWTLITIYDNLICFSIRSVAEPQRRSARTLQADPPVPSPNGLVEERLADDSAFRVVQHDRRRLAGCHLLERRQESCEHGRHFHGLGQRLS